MAMPEEQRAARARILPPRWPLIALAVVTLGGVTAAIWYYAATRNIETTDDAYTDGRTITIAPRVAGTVVEFAVDDNRRVHAGDLLLRIDQRGYLAARDKAAASLALAKAQLASADAELDVARVKYPALLAEARARRDAVQSSLALATAQFARQHAVDPRATTREAIDHACTQIQSARAALAQRQAEVGVARLVPTYIHQAETQVSESKARVAEATAQLAEAELNLSYTELRAPEDGWITKRNVERGTFVQAGQAVFTIVTPEIWVTANFKETQLRQMRAGQEATISVDAYPQLRLHGHVDSLQMGTGSRFSAFPPENATGNWIKIVQRLPVKIVIDSGLDPNLPLPLGLSVTPQVTVK
jgi:membrane fusion protein, multidrug efflux system